MGCNWTKLLAQNRCKAIGVSWSGEELHAIYQLKIPADFVRNGCLTLEDYQNTNEELDSLKSEGKDVPLIHLNRTGLETLAGKLEIQFTPEVTRADLIHLITIEQSKLLVEEEKPEDIAPDEVADEVVATTKPPFCDSCDSKGVRHKKECPKAQATSNKRA